MIRPSDLPSRAELDEVWFGEYGDYNRAQQAIAEANRIGKRRGWIIRSYSYSEVIDRMRETGVNNCCEVSDEFGRVRPFGNVKGAIYSLMVPRLQDAPEHVPWNHCTECGKEFVISYPHQLSCSDACEAIRAERTARPERSKEHRR